MRWSPIWQRSKPSSRPLRLMRSILAAALRNRISAVGLAITTASGLIFLFLVGLELLNVLRSPYAGIVVFLMVPALFAFGLLLIPIGVWRDRQSRQQVPGKPSWPKLDLGTPDMRRALLFVAAATVVNVALLSFASYGAVQYSDSEQFCGQAIVDGQVVTALDLNVKTRRL